MRLAQAAAALEAGEHVWPSADVLGAASWLRREAQRRSRITPGAPRLLSAAEEWWLWRQCAAEASAALPLIDARALTLSLARARELAADYRIELRAGEPGTEAALLYDTVQAFRGRCRSLGAGSVELLLEQLPTGLSSQAPVLPCGFAALSPRLAALLPPAVPPPETALATPVALTANDTPEELAHIAAWCEARLSRAPDARLLVMLPGAPGTRERLATLIRQELDPRGALGADSAVRVALEGGRPLSEQPRIVHALTTLTFLADRELEFEACAAWLRAPEWQRPSDALRAQLVLALRERGLLRLDRRVLLGALQLMPRALQGAGRELGADLARAAAAFADGAVTPRAWAERVRAALAVLGWPGAGGTEPGAQHAALRWHELLEEFGSLTPSLGTQSREDALEALSELSQLTAYREADVDAPVTVSGELTDPVVRYDGIWAGSLSADVLPQPVQPDAFLPLEVQRRAGVPAAAPAARLAQAQTLLRAWRASTSELVLSSPRHAEDLELLPSPLLAALPAPPDARPARSLAARLHRPHATELLTDVRGERWHARLLPRGTRTLDLQNACAFRAYAELHLGALEAEVPEPGVPARQRGLLLHKALEIFWQQLRTLPALQALGPGALQRLIDASVAQAVQALLREPPRHRRRRRVSDAQLELFGAVPAPLARECRRAARLIARLCELERARAPFTIEQAERSTELSLAGATLSMRIDRVDRLSDGSLALLDYKSGAHASADWYGERPSHPQLLAYAEVLGEEVAALATVHVAAKQVRFEGIARTGGLLPQVRAVHAGPGQGAGAAWQERRRAWRAVLERLIGAFLAGDAAVDPKAGACRHCHLMGLCRIAEQQGGEGEDE